MDIEVKRFLKVLLSLETETPKTVDFENEYPQSAPRWWTGIEDNRENLSKQKYHIYENFLCCACHGGSLPKKGDKTCDNDCAKCFKTRRWEWDFDTLCKGFDLEAHYQNRMHRPEMYLWFVEAFGFLNGKELKECFDKAASIYNPEDNNYIDVKNLIEKNYGITWDAIAERANEIADEMKI